MECNTDASQTHEKECVRETPSNPDIMTCTVFCNIKRYIMIRFIRKIYTGSACHRIFYCISHFGSLVFVRGSMHMPEPELPALCRSFAPMFMSAYAYGLRHACVWRPFMPIHSAWNDNFHATVQYHGLHSRISVAPHLLRSVLHCPQVSSSDSAHRHLPVQLASAALTPAPTHPAH
jgi:hypothetical protein